MSTKEQSNYPVQRIVGWMGDQSISWEAIELKARFLNENFNLTNSKSFILIEAVVKVKNTGTKIKSIHISQRYIQEDAKTIALIEMVPYFLSDKKNVNDSFAIRVKEPVENLNWGPNYYRVKIENQTVDLIAHQRK